MFFDYLCIRNRRFGNRCFENRCFENKANKIIGEKHEILWKK